MTDATSPGAAPSDVSLNEGPHWQYQDWFGPHLASPTHPAILAAADLVDNCDISNHPFFSMAAKSHSALRLWVSQELVVTNPFSQLLLTLGASLRNVHVRSMLMQVAIGEHGSVRSGVAHIAHPWLLHKLGISVGLEPKEVAPLAETLTFWSKIEKVCRVSSLAAVGALGMGSERLLIPEYTAIRDSFTLGWPECEFRSFLDANIDEDVEHSSIMEIVGACLIEAGADPNEFVVGARVAVDARLAYYSSLADRMA